MTGERARGAVLYGCAAVLLVAGVGWWLSADPREHAEPQLERWRASAERLLPEGSDDAEADTMALPAGVDHEVQATLATGEYRISVLCIGAGRAGVRVSLGAAGADSGRGLSCTEAAHQPDVFSVAVAGPLRMRVSVSEDGPVIFRYSLAPLHG